MHHPQGSVSVIKSRRKSFLIAVGCFVAAATVGIWTLQIRSTAPPETESSSPPSNHTEAALSEKVSEYPLAASSTREPKTSSVAASKLKYLTSSERAKFDKAIGSFKDFLKELEHNNSVLRWNRSFDDRSVFVYELSPPSESELAAAQREIDRLIEEHRMSPKERRTFANYASESIKNTLIPNDQTGCLYLETPVDPQKNVSIYRTVGQPNIDLLVKELTDSDGKNFSLGGGGQGQLSLISRTDPGWRYEKFITFKE